MEYNFLLQNLWWEHPDRIHQDPVLKKLAALPIHFNPQVITTADLAQAGVMTLRGPRQVGKTTQLKLLIRQLLQTGHDPQRILYYSTDLIADDTELFSLLKNYLDFAPEGKRYIFLDEITMVNRWEYAIKHIIDLGLGENILFILTGSSAFDLRRGGERLPGRRGIAQPDRALLPLSFRQFCSLQDFAELEILDIGNWLKSLPAQMPKLQMFFPRIESLFLKYLHQGGFLTVMADMMQEGQIGARTLETYKTVVISDFEKLRKDRITVRNISRKLIDALATPVSWNGLAQDIGSISVSTVKDYLHLFADSFTVFILEFLDKGHFRPSQQKNKKLFPFDPFIYQVLAQIGNKPLIESIEFTSKKIEGVVGSALVRVTEPALFEGFSSLGATFYWRSARGKEIDFVVIWNDEEMPIEVKYQSRVTPGNYITIKKSFGKGMVLTKDAFFQDDQVIGLPVSCFLYLLP